MDAQEQRMLLELAAKAAGKDIDPDRYDEDWGFAIRHLAKWWNPLADDGDALRLAVFLLRDIHFWYFENSVSVGNELRVACGDDPCAATRLAIVRAAAEIGRNMK